MMLLNYVTLVQIFAVIVVSKFGITSSSAPADSVLVFERGEGGYYCHKIPYLLRTVNNTLLAWAEARGKDGRTACDDFTGTDLVIKRSEDNGKSWSPLTIFFTDSTSENATVVGNAAPVQDLSTGRIWVPFCRNNLEVFMTSSDDDGLTWSNPVLMPHLAHSDWKWIGLGPPGGIQLASGRLLIPGYHTFKWRGDGCVSHGYIIYSDDHGVTWQLGSEDFGAPFLLNECQAVQLGNGSVLVNGRLVTNNRVQVLSHDGGLTFDAPTTAVGLTQPLEGCEGSIIRDPLSDTLYYSGATSTSIVRMNMTIFKSVDQGVTWQQLVTVDKGSVAYSSLQIIPALVTGELTNGLEILYERSNKPTLVFDPDEIRYWRVL